LANDVDWDEEKECFESLAASISDFYAFHPPLLPNPSGEGSKFYQISKSKCSIEQSTANEQQNIDQETQANISIFRKDERPKCAAENEELVQVTGEANVVRDALI